MDGICNGLLLFHICNIINQILLVMKKMLFSLLCSAAIISCNKSDTPAITGGGSMSATVDGSSWNATLAVQGTITSGVLSVAGTGTAGQINLTVGTYTGPKTYTIGAAAPSVSAMYTLTTSPFTSYSATSVLGAGSITVTSDTGGYVEGTFSFDGKNNTGPTILTKSITTGTFKAKL